MSFVTFFNSSCQWSYSFLDVHKVISGICGKKVKMAMKTILTIFCSVLVLLQIVRCTEKYLSAPKGSYTSISDMSEASVSLTLCTSYFASEDRVTEEGLKNVITATYQEMNMTVDQTSIFKYVSTEGNCTSFSPLYHVPILMNLNGSAHSHYV